MKDKETGRAELLGSMILNTVLQHNQHLAFSLFSHFIAFSFLIPFLTPIPA